MKRRNSWKVANSTDMTVYNTKLARKLRKLTQHALRVANHYGVTYVDLVVMGDYISARAQEEDGATATTVVDDYMFTIQGDYNE